MKVRFLSLIAIAFLGSAVYSNTLHVPFYEEDYSWMAYVSDPQKSLTTGNAGALLEAENPVVMMTFALNYFLRGEDVFSYHLINLIVHIFAAFGLFLLLEVTLIALDQSQKGFFIPFCASLLWLVNPVHTQAVTYIAQRANGIAAMLYIYAILFYAKGRLSRKNKGRIIYFLLCFILALLAFKSAFVLLLLILLYEACIIRKGNLDFLKGRGIYITALTAILILSVFFAIGYPEALVGFYPGSGTVMKEDLFTQAKHLLFHASLFFLPLPSRLSIEHDPGISRSLFDSLATTAGVAAVVTLAVYSIASFKKRPYHVFFLFWFMGTLFAELLSGDNPSVREQCAYLPNIGLSAIAGKWVMDLSSDHKRRGLWLFGAVIIIFSSMAYIRNSVWREPVDLWSDAVKKAPFSVDAHVGLALSLLSSNKMEEGIAELEKAKEVNPRDPYVRYCLGVAFYEYKVYDKAVDEFKAVWRMGLDSPAGKTTIDTYLFNIAKSFIAHGKVEKGRGLLIEAGKVHPENMKIRQFLNKLDKGDFSSEDLRP